MDTKKKTFHCKTTTEQELTGKKILQNCRNQLYLDFPYLDGAFTNLEYKADSSIDTIGTDGELIYFNPVFLMKKYTGRSGSSKKRISAHAASLSVPSYFHGT